MPAGMPGCGGRGTVLVPPPVVVPSPPRINVPPLAGWSRARDFNALYARPRLVTPPIVAASPMLLSVHASGRYLVNAQGTPVRLKADAAWINYHNFSVADQNAYFQAILALGFNATVVMGLCKNVGTWGVVNQPNNFDNDPPFSGAPYSSTPGAAYHAKLKDYIDRAQSYGLYVIDYHDYSGAGSDGWAGDLVAASNTDVFNYGAYLGVTFTQPNLIWAHFGDRTAAGTELTRWQNLIAGIQSVTRNRLALCELDGPNTIITAQSGVTLGVNPATSDLQISSYYGQGAGQNGQPYLEAIESYDLSVTGTCGPAYQTEPNYYLAFYDLKNSRFDIRAMIAWALSSGSLGGTNFGDDQRWDGRSGMLASLSSAPTADMSRINALFDSLSWQLMQPSGTSSSCPIRGAAGGANPASFGGRCGRQLVVTRGGGSNTADASFISSMLSSDGNHMIVYVPPTGTGTTTFELDFGSMSGTCTGYRVDVTTGSGVGSVTTLSTYTTSNHAQSFTTPGANAAGDSNDYFYVFKVPS